MPTTLPCASLVLLPQLFYVATTCSTSCTSEERLIAVGRVKSTLSAPLRSKLTTRLAELAEQHQNRITKRAGMKALDSSIVVKPKPSGGLTPQHPCSSFPSTHSFVPPLTPLPLCPHGPVGPV